MAAPQMKPRIRWQLSLTSMLTSSCAVVFGFGLMRIGTDLGNRGTFTPLETFVMGLAFFVGWMSICAAPGFVIGYGFCQWRGGYFGAMSSIAIFLLVCAFFATLQVLAGEA